MRYDQDRESTGFFSNVTTVLRVSGLVGDDTGDFSRSRELSPNPSLVQGPLKRQDRHAVAVTYQKEWL